MHRENKSRANHIAFSELPNPQCQKTALEDVFHKLSIHNTQFSFEECLQAIKGLLTLCKT